MFISIALYDVQLISLALTTSTVLNRGMIYIKVMMQVEGKKMSTYISLSDRWSSRPCQTSSWAVDVSRRTCFSLLAEEALYSRRVVAVARCGWCSGITRMRLLRVSPPALGKMLLPREGGGGCCCCC